MHAHFVAQPRGRRMRGWSDIALQNIPSSEMVVVRGVAPTVAAVIDRLVAVTHPKRSVRALDRSAKGYPVSGCRQEVPKRQAEMRGAISKSVGSALMKALYAAAMFDETPSESGCGGAFFVETHLLRALIIL